MPSRHDNPAVNVLNIKLTRADYAVWKKELAATGDPLTEWLPCMARAPSIALYILQRKGGTITARSLAVGVELLLRRDSYSVSAAKAMLSRLKEYGLIEPDIGPGEWTLVDPIPFYMPRSSPTKGS